jgi:hypothetical protein
MTTQNTDWCSPPKRYTPEEEWVLLRDIMDMATEYPSDDYLIDELIEDMLQLLRVVSERSEIGYPDEFEAVLDELKLMNNERVNKVHRWLVDKRTSLSLKQLSLKGLL